MTDAFELLGLVPTALLQREQIDAAVRARVLALGAADSPDTRQALNLAAAELKSPVARCRALMARSGWSVPGGAFGSGGSSDQAMLLRVFALRERLAEARAGRALDEVHRVAEAARSRQSQVLAEFESCVTTGAPGAAALGAAAARNASESAARASVVARLVQLVDELHYVTRVLEEARSAEDAID